MFRPRPLTHDERKAAEAAFRGLPLNPRWTEGAKSIYFGIRSALAPRIGTISHSRLEDLYESECALV